jgi:hypothetical protein
MPGGVNKTTEHLSEGSRSPQDLNQGPIEYEAGALPIRLFLWSLCSYMALSLCVHTAVLLLFLAVPLMLVRARIA